ELLPILSIPGIACYSLQKSSSHEDLTSLPSHIQLHDLEPQLGDFGDLAVIIDQLDLVISVDSPVAHIAGALGKKAWTLLSRAADWRWMLEGETMPWYPTMRLIRQTHPGDWTSVIERAAEELSKQKFESRNPKFETNPNDQTRKHEIQNTKFETISKR